MPSHIPERRIVASSTMLTALAAPSRLAILSHLMSVGPQTATECAGVVGLSASNCSWHLRELARLGLVERADDDADARKRPWRASITGIDLESGAGPADALARNAVRAAALEESGALLSEYRRRESEMPKAWRDAAAANDYAIQVTAAELADILERIDAVVRPYIRATRGEVPSGSAVARVSVRGFADPRSAGPRW